MLFDAQNLLTWKENKEKINLIHCLILRKKYTQPYEKNVFFRNLCKHRGSLPPHSKARVSQVILIVFTKVLSGIWTMNRITIITKIQTKPFSLIKTKKILVQILKWKIKLL